MNEQEFALYIPTLNQGPFSLYPPLCGYDRRKNSFVYVDHDRTHVTIKSIVTNNEYILPLVLIEFANPWVLRLTRNVKIFNGSFV